LSVDEDAADVTRVLNGDLSAFECIVRRWQARLVALAWRFFRNQDLAEEMAQEALLKIYRSLSRWRKEAAFSTWAFAVALNLYRSRLRRFSPEFVALEAATGEIAPASPDLTFEQEDFAREVRRAVALLPAKYRDALVLFYFHSMNLSEAAASLDIPEGTLKAQLHRGRAMLAKRLKGTFSAIKEDR